MRSRRRGGKARSRVLRLVGLTAVLAAVAAWAINKGLRPGPWQRVFATREGLEGRRTATGDIIRAGARFVALPHRRALRRDIEIRYGGRVLIVPVRDVGPWNIDDAYWERGDRPAAERGRGAFRRPTNPAGIDLSDTVYAELGLRGNDYVEWRFVHQGYVPLLPL